MRYWTKLNTILLVLILAGLVLLGTTNMWVPRVVNKILERESNGKFMPLSAQINSY